MKKFLLSAFIVISFAIYSLSQRRSSDASNVIASPPSAQVPSETTNPSPVSAPAATPNPAPTPTPAPTPAPAPKGQYNDGSYTGSVADAYYGNIQVRAIITNGKIADVVFLQYPNDRSTSREINGQAMPYLKEEALAVQSANVDIVSGATDSSLAFRQSLASALNQARQ
jgi:uncharacterized protein with FMN-binding domain